MWNRTPSVIRIHLNNYGWLFIFYVWKMLQINEYLKIQKEKHKIMYSIISVLSKNIILCIWCGRFNIDLNNMEK